MKTLKKNRQRATLRLALLTLSCLVLTNLSTLVHLAMETHRVCQEHGELIHGTVAPSSTSSNAPSTDSRKPRETDRRSIRPRSKNPAENHESTDHCSVSWTRREITNPSVAEVHPAPAATEWSQDHATRPVNHTLTVLQVAPKTPPPQA